jgi:hypothetical protein
MNIAKKKRIRIIRSSPLSPLAYNSAEYDRNIQYLIGWPGYRTANGRSGLGYMETQAEWAHMQGVMIRRMMMGRFKTRNPIYLSLITLFGLSHASPIVLLFTPSGKYVLLHNLPFFLPPALIGIMLLVNVVLSLIKCEKGESMTGD